MKGFKCRWLYRKNCKTGTIGLRVRDGWIQRVQWIKYGERDRVRISILGVKSITRINLPDTTVVRKGGGVKMDITVKPNQAPIARKRRRRRSKYIQGMRDSGSSLCPPPPLL